MKTNLLSKKNLLLKGLLLLSIVCANVYAAEKSSRDIFCGGTQEIEVEVVDVTGEAGAGFSNHSPFTEIDYKETIKKMPKQQQAEAKRLLAKLKSSPLHAGKFTVPGEKVSANMLDSQTELDDMICRSGVQIKTVNLLEKLPKEKRVKAEKLWKELNAAYEVQHSKMQELDAILNSVDINS